MGRIGLIAVSVAVLAAPLVLPAVASADPACGPGRILPASGLFCVDDPNAPKTAPVVAVNAPVKVQVGPRRPAHRTEPADGERKPTTPPAQGAPTAPAPPAGGADKDPAGPEEVPTTPQRRLVLVRACIDAQVGELAAVRTVGRVTETEAFVDVQLVCEKRVPPCPPRRPAPPACPCPVDGTPTAPAGAPSGTFAPRPVGEAPIPQTVQSDLPVTH